MARNGGWQRRSLHRPPCACALPSANLCCVLARPHLLSPPCRPRDARTAAKIDTDLALLRRYGVPTDVLEVKVWAGRVNERMVGLQTRGACGLGGKRAGGRVADASGAQDYNVIPYRTAVAGAPPARDRRLHLKPLRAHPALGISQGGQGGVEEGAVGRGASPARCQSCCRWSPSPPPFWPGFRATGGGGPAPDRPGGRKRHAAG